MSTLLEQASLVLIPSGYKEDTVYSVIPSNGTGDMSFTRASNGTRINSDGLVEVCPWNLVTYSNDFSSSWALIGSSKSTGVTDPIGNSNAIKLKYTTANSGHYTYQLITLTGANAHSVYAKAGELQFLQIASAQSIDEYANFNLGTGAIGTYGSLASNVQIENVGNGWYRCSVVFTSGSNGIYLAIVQSASSNWLGISSYAGANSTDGLYLYGGQVNAGTLKPYFPTTDRLNVPRLTYQNGGGGCPSLLLEPQRTNLLTYSEDFTIWTKGQFLASLPTVTADYGISPSGVQNADRVQMTRPSGASYVEITKQLFITIGTVITFSVFIKSLIGATKMTIGGTGSSNTINLTNDWVRYTYTMTTTNNPTTFTIAINGSAADSLTADFLVWGAQVESGAYQSSYIPTVASSATRIADACSKTGISSLIGQTEGTIFVDINLPNNAANDIFTFADTGVNDIFLASNGGNLIARIYSNSNALFFAQYSITASGGRFKMAISYKSGDSSFYVNGTLLSNNTGSINFTNTLSTINFTNNQYAGVNNKNINQSILFKTRLTNSELATLTTI